MSTRVLVIGLDAAEATLIERWADAGHLPHMRALIGRSAGFSVGNSLKTLPGAIWPELATGISCGRVPHYYHPGQLHTGEAERRPVAPEEVDAESYFWVRAARSGLKIAALDVPQTVAAPDLGGIQLFEWGLHDRNFSIASVPDEFLMKVKRRYGDHPVLCCDDHGETAEGYHALLEKLRKGVALKTKLIEETLASAEWDLFTAVYGETHCVGHQFWHFQDMGHPWHDADAPTEFSDAIFDIYRRVDEGIGRLVAAAGPEARIIFLTSHGMGRYTGGPNLLPELLARLGLSLEQESGAARFVRGLQRDQSRAAYLVRAVLRPLIGKARLRAAQARFGALHAPLTHAHVRATDLPNNRCGAIRLNLKGREPYGSVAPGNEELALLEDIRGVLSELRDPASGAPVVLEARTATEAFGPSHHADVPDLMVVFRDDLGVLDGAVSSRLGRIDAPVYKRILPRSGDHTTQSRIWIAGPGIGHSFQTKGNVLDLAPTVLAQLGIEARDGMDGRPLL